MLVLPFAKDGFVEIKASNAKDPIWVLSVVDLDAETGDSKLVLSEVKIGQEPTIQPTEINGWYTRGTKVSVAHNGAGLVIHVLPPERQSGRVRIGFEDKSFNYIINRPGYSKQRPKTAV